MSIENEKENKKLNVCLQEIFQGFQNCLCFYSSIKTEAVLFFIYISFYMYIIYIHIYKTKAWTEKVTRTKCVFYFQFKYYVKISVRSDH